MKNTKKKQENKFFYPTKKQILANKRLSKDATTFDT